MQEDWGELNTGKRAPTVFVLDLKRWNVKPVKGLPADSSIGQPEWTPDGMQQFYAFVGSGTITLSSADGHSLACDTLTLICHA